LSFKVRKCPSADLAKTNKIFISEKEYNESFKGVEKVVCKNRSKTNTLCFCLGCSTLCEVGTLALSAPQRTVLDYALDSSVVLEKNFVEYQCSSVTFEVSFSLPRNEKKITINADNLRALYKENFLKIPINLHQNYVLDYEDNQLLIHAAEIVGGKLDKELNLIPEDGITYALFNPNITQITFKKSQASKIIVEDASVPHTSTLLKPDFNFADLEIGGLDDEFATLFRRAFNSRLYPPKLIRDRGIKHVKGILLYGPPGTGKTLMARKIGQMLHTVEPKVINGPEVFDKYVGEAERKIRELFADAEKDQEENGDSASLHLIIFDEIDAICKKRGNSGAHAGVGDTIVNQLLSKIDGINSLDNVLLIGMTNRRDMIDEAMLRPGRLEVQLCINLPNEKGRVQIFNIHTRKLRESGGMAPDVSIEELASLTPNYTGAEIEGVVKSAQSFALNNGFDPKTMQVKSDANLLVTREHFMLALQEVRPAFGIEDDIKRFSPFGIVEYSDAFSETKKHISQYINSLLNVESSSLMAFCISGLPGTGLSSFAVSLAREGFTYVKLVLAKSFIGLSEDAVCAEIMNIFENAYKSKISAIVIDDFDAVIEFSPIGPRFSNKILQSLLVLLRQPPPEGRKLAIFVTTSMREALSMIGVDARYFYEEVELYPLTQPEQLQKVAADACATTLTISQIELAKAREYLRSNPVPVKRAIETFEFVTHEANSKTISWTTLSGSLKQHNRVSLLKRTI